MTVCTEQMRTVYFVRGVGKRGPVKIGISVNAERRRKQLETEANELLEIAAKIDGCMDDERRVHSFLWHDHIRREWFKWSPRLQQIIDSIGDGTFAFSDLPETSVRKMPGRRKPWTDAQKLQNRHRLNLRAQEVA